MPESVWETYFDVIGGDGRGFYGGWITNEVVGPFKGGPGTRDR